METLSAISGLLPRAVPFTPRAANNVHMGTVAGALKKAGNENLVSFQDGSADRTNAFAAALQAVRAAPDVHEAVFTAVQRGKCRGTYHLTGPQFCRADRTGLRLAGGAFAGRSKASAAVTSAA
jgi:hypothetical protein